MAPSILGNRMGERSLGGEAEQKHRKKPAGTAHQSKAQAALTKGKELQSWSPP